MLTTKFHFLTLVVLLSALPFLTACPAVDDDDDPDPTDDTITVSGLLLDIAAAPAPDQEVVLLQGDGVRLQTDSDGRFEFTDVTVPYDLLLLADDEAILYQNLTREDPTLLSGAQTGEERSAGLAGTIEGGAGFDESAENITARVAFASDVARQESFIADSTGLFDFEMSWYGPEEVTGTLHALEWEFDEDVTPVEFTGYGVLDNVTVVADETLDDLEITLDAVETSNLQGSITAPDGYDFSGMALWIAYGQSGAHPLLLDTVDAFDYAVPEIDGTTFTIEAVANDEDGGLTTSFLTGLQAGQTDADVTLYASPSLQSPADEADFHADDPFSFSPFENGVHLLVITAGADALLTVITDETSVTLPDLSAYGIDFQDGQTYTWQVLGVGPFDDIDAAASERYVNAIRTYTADNFYLFEDAFLGISPERSFTFTATP